MQGLRRHAAAIAFATFGCASDDPPAGAGTTSTTADTGEDPTGASRVDDPSAADDDPASDGADGTSAATDASATTDAEDTAADTTTGGPFVLEVHTELTDDGRLALRCNLPPSVEECAAIDGAPCEDADEDSLADAWEDAALERLRPLRRLDEGEPLVDDASAVLADVGRVVRLDDRYRIFVMLGFSEDYGSCGFTAHSGDSERVALDLEAWPDGGAGGVSVVGAYTAAHEGTASDSGRVFTGDDLQELVFDLDPEYREPRWVVFSSAAKHATYGSVEICENVSMVPCIDEDCGPDGVADPAAFDRLPEFVNAGEEAAPRVTDLGDVGFPGDDAWADQDFCGGQGGTSCSASVREKLLVDPF
jgi:hypothetical protein